MVENINDENFSEIIKKGNILIDCYATWCGPCKMLSPIINQLATEVKNYLFYKLDIDKNEKIALEFNIKAIPTILIFKDGKLIKNEIGFKTKDELEELIKN